MPKKFSGKGGKETVTMNIVCTILSGGTRLKTLLLKYI